MKKIKAFTVDDEIPPNAKFLCRNDTYFFYEMKIPGKKKSAPDDCEMEIVERVISYLNAKAGTKFTTKNKATCKDIIARIHEDAEPDDFKLVIDNMCRKWGPDQKMHMYLRPQTLFGNKFYSYLKNLDPDNEMDNALDGLNKLNQSVKDDQ